MIGIKRAGCINPSPAFAKKRRLQGPSQHRLPTLSFATGHNGSAHEDPAMAPPLEILEAAQKYGWDVEEVKAAYHSVDHPSPPNTTNNDPFVKSLPISLIRRPLPRSNNQEKVEILKKSIQEIGLLEPIDVLEVDGQYYGFSGCHRFQAHQELGKETILCRVRKATPQILRYHMM